MCLSIYLFISLCVCVSAYFNDVSYVGRLDARKIKVYGGNVVIDCWNPAHLFLKGPLMEPVLIASWNVNGLRSKLENDRYA